MLTYGKKMMGALPAPIVYGLGIFLEKALSLITIPLTAAYVTPDAYGDYEVLLSVCGLILVFVTVGLGDTLIRFVSVTQDQSERTRWAGELLGVALALSALMLAISLPAASLVREVLEIDIGLFPMLLTLAASSIAGTIELPLVWMRLQDRSWAFFAFSIGRTILQIGATWGALLLGFGLEGLLIANAVVGIGLATVLVVLTYAETGVRVTRKGLVRAFNYGFPVIIAALAMFCMTMLSRFFLPFFTTDQEIGMLGVATRLGMAAALPLVPFNLWWIPKYLGYLETAEQRAYSANMWGIGMFISILGVLGVSLLGPAFIKLTMNQDYWGSIRYLPAMCLLTVLGMLPRLTGAGVFVRETGYRIMTIDCAAACVALVLFAALIPAYEVWGAIIAMLVAAVLRLGLFAYLGRKAAPVHYNWAAAGTTLCVAALLVHLAPDGSSVLASIAWCTLSVLLLGAVALVMKLFVVPTEAWVFVKRLRGAHE